MRAFLFLAIGVSACSSPPADRPEAPVIDQAEIETMADGRCFATSPAPLRSEIIIEQVIAIPEKRSADGTLERPAIYRDQSREVFVPDGNPIRFETICPQDLSQSLVASIQRALAARGAFTGTPNGLMDQQTRNAILAYQAESGLRSPNMAIDTARNLGLIASAQ